MTRLLKSGIISSQNAVVAVQPQVQSKHTERGKNSMVDKRMLTPCGEQEREAAAGLVRDWNLAYARSRGHSRGV